MTTSARAVRFDENSMWVDLSDGRVIAVPLARFPRLLHATREQREQVEFSRTGLHGRRLTRTFRSLACSRDSET